ncbi:Thermonuclease [Hydrogenovibrio crunogenus]|uniref:Thermonuclease n=1 Tax=Hydrogenovibrio crunogenus TaxID=39765 RepID=A0A4P7NWL5_9GAMM|nr:thermonuclease family protein [Hydrogenovibrio crunogenus]QBZ82090.1 Thermonuclease [Hydrogenovibrio crunogenus]RUM90839.1 MAG: thermonuclease family protein [Thiomicrospira sp.]
MNSFISRPFTRLFFTSALLCIPFITHADDCAPKKIDVWVKASFALSGDTVIIQNKQYRLIGVEAPQIEKKQKFYTNGQPLAKQSQKKLNTILANHNLRVGVEYDQKRSDEFYRTYVHLYVKEGNKIINLQKLMLESGLALAQSEPPNNLHQKCYYQAEKTARQNKIALWSLVEKRPDLNYPIAPSSNITTDDEGYHIFKGKIVKVDKSSNNYILNMDTTGIRIRKADWEHFDYDQLEALEGKVIEARGYGFLFQGAMFVKIHSPYAIDRLNPVNQ